MQKINRQKMFKKYCNINVIEDEVKKSIFFELKIKNMEV
jgi:hypothetical protein